MRAVGAMGFRIPYEAFTIPSIVGKRSPWVFKIENTRAVKERIMKGHWTGRRPTVQGDGVFVPNK